MKTSQAQPAFDWRLSQAAQVLRAGGIVAHATEAVFGLAVRAADRIACDHLSDLKQRSRSQRFIVIGGNLEQLETLIRLDTPFRSDVLGSWPGPNTWILPARGGAPDWLVDNAGGIAVRVPGHAQAAALARRAGLLVSTSANVAGRPPARELFAVRRYFGDRVDYVLPGVVGAAERPSQIRNGTSGEVLRA